METSAVTHASTTPHPLDRLNTAEIDTARQVLERAGLLSSDTRFAYLGLLEPSKQEIIEHAPGDFVQRRVQAVLLDTASGAARGVTASLTAGDVEAARTSSSGTPSA